MNNKYKSDSKRGYIKIVQQSAASESLSLLWFKGIFMHIHNTNIVNKAIEPILSGTGVLNSKKPSKNP